MRIVRLAPEGFLAVIEESVGSAGSDSSDALSTPPTGRYVYSDPFAVSPSAWELGPTLDLTARAVMAPIDPGKIVGVGRNYRAHAEELGNPVPKEPLLFLKAPSSVIGPKTPILLPPESDRVEFEGEIAVVIRDRLRQATADEARYSVLGVTAACDVTARDLQRQDATFARGKSFDTFCPLGPTLQVEPDLEDLSVITRVNGEVRQQGHVSNMLWGLVDLLVYISRFMTLDPGDVVLTGTPEGVGKLEHGDKVEVEVNGVGILDSSVEKRVDG